MALIPSAPPPASDTQAGVVTTGDQTLGNAASTKTFPGNVTIEGTLTASGVGGAVTSVTQANGLTLTAGDLAMGAASDSAAGAVTTGDQTLGGAGSTKTFVNIVVGTLATLASAVTNLVRAVGAALVLRSDVGALSTDVAVKVGSSVADGSVNAAAKLLSGRTGLGGTEVEKFWVNKAGDVWTAGGKWIGNDATGNSYLSISSGAAGFSFAGGVHVFQINGAWCRYLANSQLAWYLWPTGRMDQRGTDSSGAPGAATINKGSGRSAIASGATSVTITNSDVTAATRVKLTWEGDHGAARSWVVPAAGSFTVWLSSAASGNTPFNWEVSNIL